MKLNKKFRSITIFIAISSLFFPVLKTKANEFKKGFYTSASFGLGKYSGMLQTHTENNVQSDYHHDLGFGYEANIGYDFGEKLMLEPPNLPTLAGKIRANIQLRSKNIIKRSK